jgi:hypothetical protein
VIGTVPSAERAFTLVIGTVPPSVERTFTLVIGTVPSAERAFTLVIGTVPPSVERTFTLVIGTVPSAERTFTCVYISRSLRFLVPVEGDQLLQHQQESSGPSEES